MAEQQKRQIAYKAKISDILEGRYVKEEGWQPNYILAGDGTRISRINIIAIAINIQHDSPGNTILVDDGTGKILLRSFQGFLEINGVEVGDVVNVIGKPREFGQEKYIVPEIIRKVNDRRWVEIRNIELSTREKNNVGREIVKIEEVGDTEKRDVPTPPNKVNPVQVIYSLIKELDNGEGADIEEVSKKSGLANPDSVISNLLKEGEIFEIRRGKLKILE